MPQSSAARQMLNKMGGLGKKMASMPKKALDSYESKLKKGDDMRRAENVKMMRENGMM